MRLLLLSSAMVLSLAAVPAYVGQHNVANGTSVLTASNNAPVIQQADAGGGNGGSDRRAVEQA